MMKKTVARIPLPIFRMMAHARGFTNVEEAIKAVNSADIKTVKQKLKQSWNEEAGRQAIKAARRGDPSLLLQRKDAGQSTNAEMEYLTRRVMGKAPRGRVPSHEEKHLAIFVSIEAFRAYGMTKRAATVKAARDWCLSEETIEDIYKKERAAIPKEYRDTILADIKETFESGENDEHPIEAVTEYIAAYRGAKRKKAK